MGRLLFHKGKQARLFLSLLKRKKTSIHELAVLCGVSERSIRDWRREKYTISEDAFKKIHEHFSLPEISFRLMNDFWYTGKGARNGGLRRLALYGAPGTKEGRQKGGRMSQWKRKQFPEQYPTCLPPKKYEMPSLSANLAEFIGIVLGDGGLTRYQLKITLNSNEEIQYIDFVSNLFRSLFHEKPARYQRKNEKTCNVAIAGIKLIQIISELGVPSGSKVRRQADVPKWIKENKSFMMACLRGLMDTDGCVYHHQHVSHGVYCLNLGLTFTNRSRPLADFVFQALHALGIEAKRTTDGVYVYRKDDVDKYFSIVGFHNTHHVQRYRNFATIKAQKEGYPSGLRDTLGERA